jgi:penicillin amidase
MIKRILLWTFSTLLILVILIVTYVGITYWRASSGLPEWNGTLTAEGLDGPVEIIRDEYGIPYIEATTQRDLYFAQGFVHAQDRFWRMALARRTFQGRLSEWLGTPALNSDRLHRADDLVGLAERAWAELPAETRALVTAYAAGVNAWLDGPYYRRPPEMKFLHVHPERWRPQDTVQLKYWLHVSLGRPGDELLSTRIDQAGLPPAVKEVYAPFEQPVPTILPSDSSTYLAQSTSPFRLGAHSNSWTLSGTHTASGRPLMANDPHLTPTQPVAWHLQHHQAPGINGAGATAPGLPGFYVGHNGTVAWGITTASDDMVDVTFVEIHPDDPTRYRRGPEAPWERFALRIDTIDVRFGESYIDTIRNTPTGRLGTRRDSTLTDDPALHTEWRYWGLDLPGTHLKGWLDLQRATSVAAAIEAVGQIPGPSLNLSIADTSGSIGYVKMGRIAKRPEKHARTVAFGPEDSNAGTHLPFSENPRLIDPPSGRIVTANQRIAGDDYPHYLSGFWTLPDRAWRIHEMLNEHAVHDAGTFRAMQQDGLSTVARRLVPLLLEAEPAGDDEAALLRVLKAWDYRFTLDSRAPAIFMAWLERLNRRVIEDELGSFSFRGAGWTHANYLSVAQALAGDKMAWCDDRTTAANEDCARILRETLTEAHGALTETLGPDPNGWRWEQAGRFRLPHMPFDNFPLLRNWFSRETPVPGGPEGMFNNYATPTSNLPVSHSGTVPSFQAIYDLSDLDASLFMAHSGISGHFKSPYYDNLTKMWVRGDRITLNPEQIEEQYRLVLQPDITE